MRCDPSGELYHIIVGVAVGILSQYASDVILNLISGKSVFNSLTQTSSITDYCAAAASGAFAATGIGLIGSAVVDSVISGSAYIANEYIKGHEPDVKTIGKRMLSGAASGIIGGKGADGSKLIGIYKTSKSTLQTAVSAKKIAMYTEKIFKVKATTAISSIRTFLGNLFSNSRSRS